MHGGISHIAKQIILADQYQLDWNLVKKHNDTLTAKETMPKNVNEELETKDFNLSEESSIGDLSNQYFSNSWLAKTNNKDGDIKLDGKRGTSENQFGDLLAKLGLGSEITDLLPLIIQMIGQLDRTSIGDIVSRLPMLDGLLPDLIKDNQETIDNLLAKLDVLFKGGSDFINKMDNKLDRLAIGNQYAKMEATSFMPAMWITLSNGIGLILNPDYKQTTIPTNTSRINSSVKTAGKNFASVFKTNSGATQTEDDILGADFERYSEAVVNIVQALQFLQLHLSLFDNSWSFQPTDSNHLFSEGIDNKTYMRQVLGVESGDGAPITVESVLKKIDEGAKGVINLRYLISVLKTAVGDINMEDSYKGLPLQRLLFVIFSGPEGQKEIIDRWVDKDNNPISLFITALLVEVITDQLTKLDGIGKFEAMIIAGQLEQPISFALTKSLDAILSGQRIAPYLEKTFDALIDKIEKFLVWIPDDDKTEAVKKILKKVVEKRVEVKEILFNLVLNKIPLINAENSWDVLWSGNPLDLSNAIQSKDEVANKLEEIFGNESGIKTLVDNIFDSIDKVDKSIKNVLPNSAMNLRNILLTPIGKIAKSPSLPSDFGDHYLKLNVVEIVNEIADGLEIKGGEKINDDSMNGFNFDPGELKGLWDLIKNYTYQWDVTESNAQNTLDDSQQSSNLITLILKNPDKASKILGLTEKENENHEPIIGSGSFLDFVLNKLLRINNENEGDRVAFICKLLGQILDNLNNPKVDYQAEFQEAYGQKDAFKFEFSDLIIDEEDEIGILGETLKVTFRNSLENDPTRHEGEGPKEYVYIFRYSRDKVENNFEITEISKQLKTS